jgi:hypothetical protein
LFITRRAAHKSKGALEKSSAGYSHPVKMVSGARPGPFLMAPLPLLLKAAPPQK